MGEQNVNVNITKMMNAGFEESRLIGMVQGILIATELMEKLLDKGVLDSDTPKSLIMISLRELKQYATTDRDKATTKANELAGVTP